MRIYPSNVICTVKVSSSLFSVDNLSKRIVSEHSTISCGGAINIMSVIYSDACDMGFFLESKETFEVALFAYTETERDNDGDVLREVFEPTSETLRLFPQLKGYHLVVYND